MTTKLTCEQRIDTELNELEDAIQDVIKSYYDLTDDGFDAWNNYPLAVTTHMQSITKIEFSWGGPSDFLVVTHDGTQIESVVYYFQDWFDTASREVERGSKVWEYCQTVIDARHN